MLKENIKLDRPNRRSLEKIEEREKVMEQSREAMRIAENIFQAFDMASLSNVGRLSQDPKRMAETFINAVDLFGRFSANDKAAMLENGFDAFMVIHFAYVFYEISGKTSSYFLLGAFGCVSR